LLIFGKKARIFANFYDFLSIFSLPSQKTCAFGVKTCAFDAKNLEKLARLVRKSAPKNPEPPTKKSSRKTHFQSFRKLATAKKSRKVHLNYTLL